MVTTSSTWRWPESDDPGAPLTLATATYRLAVSRRTALVSVASAAGSYSFPLTALVGREGLPARAHFLVTTDGPSLSLYVLTAADQLLEKTVLRSHPSFFTVAFTAQLGPDAFAAPAFFTDGVHALPPSAVHRAFSPDPVTLSLSPSPTTYLGVHPPYHTAPFAPPPFDLQFRVGRGWAGVGLVQVPDATALTITPRAAVTVNYALRRLATFRDTGAGGVVPAPAGVPGHPARGPWLGFPTFVFTSAPDPASGLSQYHLALSSMGEAPTAAPPGKRPSWWSWPMVDTWGQQLLSGASRTSPRFTSAWVLNFVSAWRQQFHVKHFTLVIDAQWQARLGQPVPSSRFGGWGGMRALIQELHAQGVKVMLWWKLWVDQAANGSLLRYDPTQAGFGSTLRSQVAALVGSGPQSLGADGLKLDWGFLVPPPSAERLAHPRLGMGAALLLRYMSQLSRAAWKANPAALIDASAVAPQFGGTEDTLRLYDAHRASTWSYRAAIVSAVDPSAAIDGDGWELISSQAVPHIVSSAVFGIPSIYYVGQWAGRTRIAPKLARALGLLISTAQGRGQGAAVQLAGGGWEYLVNNRVSAQTLAGDRALVVYHYSGTGSCTGATVVSALQTRVTVPNCTDAQAVSIGRQGTRPRALVGSKDPSFEAAPGVSYQIRFAPLRKPRGGRDRSDNRAQDHRWATLGGRQHPPA